jgi:vitamin B12 transporter
VTQAFGAWRLTGETVASSERFDDAENTRQLAGYAIFNLVVEWTASPQMVFFMRADNVFDRHYELAADFATGGARVFGGVRWRL